VKKFIFGIIIGLLIPAVAGYCYFSFGMAPISTAADPMPFEKKMAQMAIRAHMTKEAPKQALVAADEPNLTQGASVYVANCAFCHGVPDGKATMAAKGMFPLPPQLFEKDDMVTDDPVGDTYWKVSGGLRMTGMPGFGQMLSPTQMWQVSQLLAHADKLPDTTKAALNPAATTAPSANTPPQEPQKPKKKK
jgi:thiosulfate dehydrogenase